MIDYFSSFPSWTIFDYAVDMIENHGFAVELWEKSSVRKAGQKGPRGKGRQANRFENSLDLERYTFTDLTEIGISTSKNEAIVDLDAQEAIDLAPNYLPDTGLISGHPGREATHWYYKLEGDDITKLPTKFMDPEPLSTQKNTLVEYIHMGESKTAPMVIIPPTPYDFPRKGNASWDRYEEAAALKAEQIHMQCGIAAAAALLARCWTDGQRNELTIALSGALLREKWTADEIKSFLKPICLYCGDDEWENRLVQPATTANRAQGGQTVYGWPTVGKLIGTLRAKRLQEWLSKLHQSGLKSGRVPNAAIPPGDVAQVTFSENENRFLFVPELKEWASYENGLWVIGYAAELAVQQTLADTRAKLVSQTRGAQPAKLRDITDAVGFLRMERAIQASQNDFDNKPNLLNGPNGTYDLEKGFLAEWDPLHILSRQMPTPYVPGATCPYWEEQMELTFPDREDREYVQRVFGYALQGTQKERAFFLFYGDGHNGKSIMLRVLEKVLGLGGHGYAQQLATATFSRSTATEINSGLAKLRGIRFASIGEFPNKSLNSELIKAMTGGESNTARQLYAKTAEFPYQCHLFFTSNNTPGPTDGTDEAFWDRMHQIPCTAQFPLPGEPGNIPEDVMLERFMAEAPGIFNWMVEGHRMWREADGLMVPEKLKKTRKEYKKDLDLLALFLDEPGVDVHPNYKSDPDDIGWTKLTEAWEVFDGWCSRVGEKKRNQCQKLIEFKHALLQKGFTIKYPYATAKNPYGGQLCVFGIDLNRASILETAIE